MDGVRSAYAVLEKVAGEREFPTLMPADEASVLLRTPPPKCRFSCISCVDGGEVIGTAWLTWPLAENQQLLIVELAVDARHRRRGVGSALLDAVRAAALSEGRSALLAETFCPYDAGAGAGEHVWHSPT